MKKPEMGTGLPKTVLPNEHKDIVWSKQFTDEYHRYIGVKPGDDMSNVDNVLRQEAFVHAYKKTLNARSRTR